MPRTLKIHPADTVAVALEPLSRGTPLDAHGLTLADDVPQGHKFALQPIVAGQPVIKYGVVIGAATSVVATGAHVHTHNLRTALSGIGDYTYAGKMPDAAPTPANPPTIRAYVRVDGQVGIRNDLWIIPLVGCINGLAQTIGRHVTQSGLLPPESRVAVPAHPYGCSQLGDDLANTRGILRNLALHPNAGGVLVLGLGCLRGRPAAGRSTPHSLCRQPGSGR
jgi:altronate hydrolase